MRLAAVTAVLLVTLAGAASADHRFADGAGFRPDAPPITVQDHPDLPVGSAAWRWNSHAGHHLLAVTDDDPAITFYNGGGWWAEVSPPFDTWSSCRISYDDRTTPTSVQVAHEIGHCLGFADHLWAAQYDSQEPNNPKVCDDPDHAAYSPYAGIEAHCGGHTFSDEDETMVRAAYPPSESTTVRVAVVNGDASADALAASMLGMPILYVAYDFIPDVTSQALHDLAATDVVIVGGTAVVSADVQRTLDIRYDVTRLAGADRFETAAVVATR